MNRELLESRLAKLPQLPPLHDPAEDLEDDEMEEMLDSFPTSSESLPPPQKKKRARNRQDLSPLSAQGYFDQALQVNVPISNLYSSSAGTTTAQFRVYYTPPSLERAEIEDDDDEESGNVNGVVFVCVHGAGYSGLSYACMAKELVEIGKGKLGVLSYDARGHGRTRIEPTSGEEGKQASMELAYMAQDLIDLLKVVFPSRGKAPALVLVGHSMGGAVVAESCNRIQESVADVLGVTVIDVVEGTALEALSGMSNLIASQPKIFDSVEAAIGWHLDSRTIKNVNSARISVPPLIEAVSATSMGATSSIPSGPARVPRRAGETEKEGDEQEEEEEQKYRWRVDLQQTEPYWKGWFTGLSSKFLGCRTAKLLILAGTDRLDKELLIGQMQGRYQLEVYPEAGHCLHEDVPERTADTLLNFWQRNDRVDVLKGVKKVGEL